MNKLTLPRGLVGSFLGTSTGTVVGGLALQRLNYYRKRRTKNGKVVIEQVRRKQ